MFRLVVAVFAMAIFAKGLLTFVDSRAIANGYRYQSVALENELATAESGFQTALATSVAANGSDANLAQPTPLPTAPACSGSCKYNANATLVITQQPNSTLASGGVSSTGNDTAYNLQRNTLIKQNTVSVAITAHVWDAVGGHQATRCALYTYRLESQQPYVDFTGRQNCAAQHDVSIEHDTGGCNSATPVSCDPTGGTQIAPSDTTVTAITVCQGANCAAQTPRPADSYVTNTWQNGNTRPGQ